MARKKSVSGTARSQPRSVRSPDWPVVGLALLGIAITAYLSVVSITSAALVGCASGSSCDLVQQSQWSTLFGLPVALWGLGLYLLVAAVAFAARPGPKRWQMLWWLSLFGLAFSVYLGLVAWIALDAVCAWCTASLLVLLALFVYQSLGRPAAEGREPWPTFLASRSAVVLVALLALHGVYAGWFQTAEDPRLEALAQHLERVGATYYGASWCPVCQQQGAAFGRSIDRLPYVECSPEGRNGPMAFECARAEVRSYPTWVIGSQRFERKLTPQELAELTRFDWEGFQPGD